MLDRFREFMATFRRPATAEAYTSAAKKFEKFRGDRPIDSNSLAAFVEHLLRVDGMAPRSVRLMLAGVRQYFLWLARQGVEIPEMAPHPEIRVRATKREVLRGESLAAFMGACGDVRDPYRTMIRMLPLTGLRVRESCRLTRQDIRADGDVWVFSIRESKGEDREVPLLPAGNHLFHSYLKRVRPRLRSVNGLPAAQQFVFPNRTGLQIDPTMVRRVFRRLRKTLDHKTLSPHLLRHTYATMLSDAGVPPFTIMDLLGHKDARTSHIYTHPNMASVVDILRRVPARWVPQPVITRPTP